VLLCLLLVGAPLAAYRLWPVPVAAADIPNDVIIELKQYDVEPPKQATPPPAQPQRRQVVVTPPAELVPKVVKELREVPKETVEPAAPTDPNAETGPVAIPGSTDPNAGSSPGTVAGNDSNVTAAPAPAAPFVHVEVMPEFAGGLEALRKYMQRNLKYPRQALANGVSGKVFVAFTVQASGDISDVQVLKGLGYGTEEEAYRVIKAMPAWTPGRQNSHPVAVRYTLPITFHYE
jgi:protein TonB